MLSRDEDESEQVDEVSPIGDTEGVGAALSI